MMGNNTWTNEADKTLEDWHRRARDGQHAHHEAARWYRFLHYALGIPVVVLSAVVGTTAFVTLQKTVEPTTKFILATCSILVATLAAVQTHWQFSQRADRHKLLGSGYGVARREIEELQAFSPQDRSDPKEALPRIRKRLDTLAEDGEEVPQHIWKRAKKLQLKRNPPWQKENGTAQSARGS